MPSTFLGLNTGLSGLNYFQTALNTTSHNVSNANTKGYSRQQVSASASKALRMSQSYGMMGTGVTANSVERLRNNYYDSKYWNTTSKSAQYEIQRDDLSQLETYMNEMTGNAGYSEWLNRFSDSLQDLSDNPSDYTARIGFTNTVDSFTDMINELATNFQNSQKSINDEIELGVSEINSLAKQIYELSQQIITIELRGGSANDLRDQRGVCIDTLAEYVDVDVEERSIMFGTGLDAVESDASAMSIRINGNILVDEMGYHELMVVPREERVNQSDVDGLVDIAWKNADSTPGEKFQITRTTGKLNGLINIRDGNNGEIFKGSITSKTDSPASVTVELPKSVNVYNLTVPAQGTITLNGKEYMYDGWTAEYDENDNLNNFTFQNMTMKDGSGAEIAAVVPDTVVGTVAQLGEYNSTKGIPYYQARLNEMVRTFSEYMNKLTTSGVDADGVDGLDMFTAVDPYGKDYVLKDTMLGTGTVSSTDSSYYKLTALNWELNSAWQESPAKVVVSYKEDIEQGNIEQRPIVDAITYGLTDVKMFQQGSVSQYMQAVTTNLAVDISKMTAFSNNQDDIKYIISNQRLSISGVDSNEEASELVKFENLYNLASKVISVLNEVYDKLINDTGR